MSKLSSVNDLVSRALTDEKIGDEQFSVTLNELESYRELKSHIRTGVRNELSSDREQEIAMSNLKSMLKGTGQV